MSGDVWGIHFYRFRTIKVIRVIAELPFSNRNNIQFCVRLIGRPLFVGDSGEKWYNLPLNDNKNLFFIVSH